MNFLKTASVETAVRVFLEKTPDSYLRKSPKLIREFLQFFSAYGIPRLSEFVLREFFVYLKNEDEASERSLLIAKSRLQGFFKFLIAHGAIDSSPLDNIKFDRGAPFRRKPILFANSDFLNLIQTAQRMSPVLFYPIFLLIYETAAKTSDVVSLRWKDVNFKDHRINLIQSTEVQPREFEVSDRLQDAIKRIERANEHIFTSLEGRPQKKYILGRELKRFQRLTGLHTKWGLKDLRASYGVNFLTRGGSMLKLQGLMGHSQLGQTKEIFGRYLALRSDLLDPAAVQESGEVSLSMIEF